ncbi:hypothetical protein OUZ56_011715 [Daphnia magna]|uniref:Uncharacterized protein n=1 Tax=Daphnia magna TaxID=35525 RepID=A0ABQ9Z0Y1_9CRUS|nr:hypothetical protein OUZ56_011715 [Daphnia magna]
MADIIRTLFFIVNYYNFLIDCIPINFRNHCPLNPSAPLNNKQLMHFVPNIAVPTLRDRCALKQPPLLRDLCFPLLHPSNKPPFILFSPAPLTVFQQSSETVPFCTPQPTTNSLCSQQLH